MSLATRCPACGTVFRVVQDQLRVSEGWVRCGRCAEVFNAVEQLVEVPAPGLRPMPPEAPPPTAHDPGSDTAPAVSLGRSADIEIEPALPIEARGQAFEAPAPPDAAIDRTDSVDLPIAIDDDDRRWPAATTRGQADALAADSSITPAPSASAGWSTRPHDAASAVDEPTLDAEAAPSFLREQASNDAWSRPGTRRVLWSLSAALLVLLLVQVAVDYRNLLAARWPALAPAIASICSWSGCRMEPPRWIEAIVVDSSGLVRVEGTQTYRLSVVLRNRAAMPLAMPAVDLTLTDLRGAVIARRVLNAPELGSNANSVAPLAELPLLATLAVPLPPGTAVAGYTIEFFYP